MEIIFIHKLVFLVYVPGICKFKMYRSITECTEDTQLLVSESKGTQFQNVVTQVHKVLPGLKWQYSFIITSKTEERQHRYTFVSETAYTTAAAPCATAIIDAYNAHTSRTFSLLIPLKSDMWRCMMGMFDCPEIYCT